jgi:hypothetical protein
VSAVERPVRADAETVAALVRACDATVVGYAKRL